MQQHTVGAIALCPTGNKQGSYYYLSLRTGKKLSRLRATELPMPQDFIDRVYTLERNNPLGLTFCDRNQNIIPDDVDFYSNSDSREPNNVDYLNLNVLPLDTSPDQALASIPTPIDQLAGVYQLASHDQLVRDPHDSTGVHDENEQDGNDVNNNDDTQSDDDDNGNESHHGDNDDNNNRTNQSDNNKLWNNNIDNTAAAIEALHGDMESTYGTRICSGLQPHCQHLTVPETFCDTEDQLHLMSHDQIYLKDYATIYEKYIVIMA